MIRNYIRGLYRLLAPMLVGKKRFKLFLNTTLGGVNLSVLELASSADYFARFVRPVVIKAPFGKSVLVVAPHQDDEAIGCGGALILQARSGGAASIVLLQDGADEHHDLGLSRDALRDLRNEESRKAAAAAGLQPPLFLNHPRLDQSVAEAAEQLRQIVERERVDAMFVPFLLDGHPDHRTACRIVAEALKPVHRNIRILGYEVWGLCIPNVLVVIDDAIEQKMKMIDCFTWANKAVDYTHSTRGLNMFHSRMLGAGECRYAERFFELPREEFIELVERTLVRGSQSLTTPA